MGGGMVVIEERGEQVVAVNGLQCAAGLLAT